ARRGGQVEERVDLALDTVDIVGKAGGLLHELPEQEHVLYEARGSGEAIQLGQFEDLVGFDEDRLDGGEDGLNGTDRVLREIRRVEHGKALGLEEVTGEEQDEAGEEQTRAEPFLHRRFLS